MQTLSKVLNLPAEQSAPLLNKADGAVLPLIHRQPWHLKGITVSEIAKRFRIAGNLHLISSLNLHIANLCPLVLLPTLLYTLEQVLFLLSTSPLIYLQGNHTAMQAKLFQPPL